ncbi:hypothetical protein AURDEDRAFT_164413 [Auricularia subglabra TFB-10046 SS5]|nr:hypothetical protein AURDEDRAFT_164413 [Auricularia subglabra TFB-10046 SS5]
MREEVAMLKQTADPPPQYSDGGRREWQPAQRRKEENKTEKPQEARGKPPGSTAPKPDDSPWSVRGQPRAAQPALNPHRKGAVVPAQSSPLHKKSKKVIPRDKGKQNAPMKKPRVAQRTMGNFRPQAHKKTTNFPVARLWQCPS